MVLLQSLSYNTYLYTIQTDLEGVQNNEKIQIKVHKYVHLHTAIEAINFMIRWVTLYATFESGWMK